MKLLSFFLQVPVPPTIWDEFAKAGPVVLVMGLVIWWLSRQLERKEKQLESKNEYIQQMAEKSIGTLKDVQGTMDKVFDNQVAGNQELQREIMDNCIKVQNNLSDMIKDLKEHLPKKENEPA